MGKTEVKTAPDKAEQLPAVQGGRIPYHPVIKERYNIDGSEWRALTDAIFPAAQSIESIMLALSYCKARRLDPFKRSVHIVPIWDKKAGAYVDTVWPGIAELRTTAFRTGSYAGRDPTKFGDDVTTEWKTDKGEIIAVTHPEWAQVTVYRMVQGQRAAFEGPRTYWLETFSDTKGGAPNAMWRKRPSGQLEKCAEAAALRAAFPEETGGEYIDTEAHAQFRADAPAVIEHQKKLLDGAPKRSDYNKTETAASATLPPEDREVSAMKAEVLKAPNPERKVADSAGDQSAPKPEEAGGSYEPEAAQEEPGSDEEGMPPKTFAELRDLFQNDCPSLDAIERTLSYYDPDIRYLSETERKRLMGIVELEREKRKKGNRA